jgi:diguanylate cyclase (GGDEF)-like protein
MISSTLLLVLGGCVLGIIQLLAGIGIGMWLRRDDTAAAQRNRQDMIQASRIAKRLQALADDVSSSVGQHASHLEQATKTLTSDSGRTDEALAELVVDVIDDIVRANHSLKSKLDSAESKLQEQAVEIEAHISRSLTDTVTGLPNRREFNERLGERMSAWNRRKEVFTLMLLDVDNFKRLNDQHGHVVGDRVLAGIGHALRTSVRREDAVARFGGEEFAVLLPSTSLEQAVRAAQKVREAIGRVAVNHNGRKISVTASGGLAMIQSKEEAESLIQRADAALYAAKAAGRNRLFLHDGKLCRASAGGPSPRRAANQASPKTTAPVKSLATTESPASTVEIESPSTPAGNLTNDEISAELAQTCEELRRFIAERDGQHLHELPGTQA